MDDSDGTYVMPRSISPELKDLIARMFVVDTSKRITMDRIKTHPWVREHLPIYASIASSYQFNYHKIFRPDEGILEEVISHKYTLPQTNQKELMIKAIKRREYLSFVVAYRLLEDERNRKAQGLRKTNS